MSHRIHLEVYGPHHPNAGELIDFTRPISPEDHYVFDLPAADAELYLRHCISTPTRYHQRLTLSLEAALEHRAQQVAEDIIEEQQPCTLAKCENNQQTTRPHRNQRPAPL